jgi:hypothetical protein
MQMEFMVLTFDKPYFMPTKGFQWWYITIHLTNVLDTVDHLRFITAFVLKNGPVFIFRWK